MSRFLRSPHMFLFLDVHPSSLLGLTFDLAIRLQQKHAVHANISRSTHAAVNQKKGTLGKAYHCHEEGAWQLLVLPKRWQSCQTKDSAPIHSSCPHVVPNKSSVAALQFWLLDLTLLAMLQHFRRPPLSHHIVTVFSLQAWQPSRRIFGNLGLQHCHDFPARYLRNWLSATFSSTFNGYITQNTWYIRVVPWK